MHGDQPEEAAASAPEKSARQVWTTSEVGERLGYSEQTVRRMCEAGRFVGAYRNGLAGHWRIPDADIEAFLESMRPKRRRAQSAR